MFEMHAPQRLADLGRALRSHEEWASIGVAQADLDAPDEAPPPKVKIANHPGKAREPEPPRRSATELAWSMDMRDDVFTEDASPLVEGCPCYACANHTRKYLHHLLTVKELLAPTLLYMHNVQQLSDWFAAQRATRSAKEEVQSA